MGNVVLIDYSLSGEIDAYLARLFPLSRSITGNGNRETLRILQELAPIKIREFPSGKEVYGWTIPDEWNLKEAWIKDELGNVLVDVRSSNLHVVGYSTSINRNISFTELQEKLHYLPDLPEAIPYRTTYYKKDWGFCVTKKQYDQLAQAENLEVFIDAEFDSNGSLTIGELIIPGKTDQEILISTYICHPSLANDNLSGPVLTSFLAREMLRSEQPNHTWRIIFVPETIGAITYCAENEDVMKNINAGFVVTTVGGPGPIGYKQSYDVSHPINTMIEDVFLEDRVEYLTYPYDFHGSDERQYSSIGFRINVASITKDKYYEYDYYHTSLDNLKFVRGHSICESLHYYRKAVRRLDGDIVFRNRYPNGEVMLAKFGLYPEDGAGLNPGMKPDEVLDIRMKLLFFMDGSVSVGRLANLIDAPVEIIYQECILLERYSIIERIPEISHRLILSASDAGPAEYIARIAKHVNIPYRIYASKLSEPIFHKHGMGCIRSSTFQNERADLIVTGTHKGAGIDKDLVQWGRSNNIPTISIVDHWTFMEDRFFIGDEKVLPDKIFLNDIFALNQLEKAGISKDLVTIVGNPILEEQAIETRELHGSSVKTYDDHLGDHSLVYISEELASAFPTESSDYPGFDEFRVLSDLLDCVPSDQRVVVKLHPEEREDKYDTIQARYRDNELIVVKECNTENLLKTAEFVIGMGSMLLIEAAKTRTDVISYRPGQRMTFVGNEMGVTQLVRNRAELMSVISGETKVCNDLVGSRFSGSMKKIITVVNAYIHPHF